MLQPFINGFRFWTWQMSHRHWASQTPSALLRIVNRSWYFTAQNTVCDGTVLVVLFHSPGISTQTANLSHVTKQKCQSFYSVMKKLTTKFVF